MFQTVWFKQAIDPIPKQDEIDRKLKAYFGTVVRGNDQEYRTAFGQDSTLSELVDDWFGHLDKIKVSNEVKGLYEYESEMKGKVGPLSIQKPLRERMDDIDSYWRSIYLESEPFENYALDAVVSQYGPHTIKRRSKQLTWANMKKSTNSGAPYFTKRHRVEAALLQSTLKRERGQVYLVDPYTKCIPTAILGWRGQEGGIDFDSVKQRVVWMFPAGVNLAELSVYQPLIERAQSLGVTPAWISMDAVDTRITQLFNTKGAKDPIICTDFTKFDQHFNFVCQNAARYILKQLVVDPWNDWDDIVFPIKYTIPLQYSMHGVRGGAHGMGSGSGGTNADETLVHTALQIETAALFGKSGLNPNSMCLGDDGILTYPGIDVSDVVTNYQRHGLEMNPSKQSVSDVECTYLRRWHGKNYRVNGVCVGVYSTCRALGRLCEQERFYDPRKWGPKMVALRQLSILENVKWHPLKEEFVKWCLPKDKYRLGLDLPGFLDDLPQLVEESKALADDFIGYVQSNMSGKSGINDWWIVRYLKSLR